MTMQKLPETLQSLINSTATANNHHNNTFIHMTDCM